MAEENKNGVNAPEENKRKGFKERAKDAWTWVTTNPVTKTAGKILLAAGLIAGGAFIGGVGVGIKEERLRAKDHGEPVENLPVEEAPAEEAEVEADEASFEDNAPVEEQAEE